MNDPLWQRYHFRHGLSGIERAHECPGPPGGQDIENKLRAVAPGELNSGGDARFEIRCRGQLRKSPAATGAKIIPVVGAVFSGALTLATFLPMSKRLQRHLASLELTKPGHRA